MRSLSVLSSIGTRKAQQIAHERRIYYCVANMPGTVPHISTISMTDATLPYAATVATCG